MNLAGGVYIAPPVWYDGTTNDEKETIMLIKTITVTGDSGKDYTIRADVKRGVVCECPAFYFSSGKPCKHIQFVQERILSAD